MDDYPLCDWEDAPDYHAVSYDLWYSTESDFDPHEELTGLTDSEHQFSDTELDPDTTYHWKVVATDGYLETWSSETWSFYVPNNVGIDGVELAANPAADGVLLGWSISGELPAGRHAVAWDCAGEAAGVYLLRLETRNESLSRRVVIGH